MELMINGDVRLVKDVSNANELLHALSLDPRAVVVELNRTIVRRAQLETTPVQTGDVIEIVHFVGGG